MVATRRIRRTFAKGRTLLARLCHLSMMRPDTQRSPLISTRGSPSIRTMSIFRFLLQAASTVFSRPHCRSDRHNPPEASRTLSPATSHLTRVHRPDHMNRTTLNRLSLPIHTRTILISDISLAPPLLESILPFFFPICAPLVNFVRSPCAFSGVRAIRSAVAAS